MHADIQPAYPFSLLNGLYQYISVEALHRLCIYSGLIGAAIYYLISMKEEDN